jgi:hypothetical protein
MHRRRNTCRILVGKPEGKTPLARPRHNKEYNIVMHLRELGWHGKDWYNVA